MQITKRQTEIILDEKEKVTLEDAWSILYDIANEIGCDGTLFGYNESDWTCILDELDNAIEEGKITIE